MSAPTHQQHHQVGIIERLHQERARRHAEILEAIDEFEATIAENFDYFTDEITQKFPVSLHDFFINLREIANARIINHYNFRGQYRFNINSRKMLEYWHKRINFSEIDDAIRGSCRLRCSPSKLDELYCGVVSAALPFAFYLFIIENPDDLEKLRANGCVCSIDCMANAWCCYNALDLMPPEFFLLSPSSVPGRNHPHHLLFKLFPTRRGTNWAPQMTRIPFYRLYEKQLTLYQFIRYMRDLIYYSITNDGLNREEHPQAEINSIARDIYDLKAPRYNAQNLATLMFNAIEEREMCERLD